MLKSSLFHKEVDSSSTTKNKDKVIQTVYEGYTTGSNCIILYSSVDAIPIASVHLIPRSDEKSKTLISVHPGLVLKDADIFQGIITRDEKEIAFAITNLLVNENLHVNIYPCDKDGKTQNNIMNINKINALYPLETVIVDSNQTTEKTIVLQKINNITLEESESKEAREEKRGTYFKFIVHPDSFGITTAKMTRTEWRCSDFVVLMKSTIIQEEKKISRDDTKSSDSTNEEKISKRERNKLKMEAKKIARKTAVETAKKKVSTVGLSNDVNETKTKGKPNKKKILDEELPPITKNKCVYLSANEDIHINSLQLLNFPSRRDIMESFAARTIIGNNDVKVKAVNSEMKFNFSYPANTCILGLSICSGVDFSRIDIKSTQIQIKDLINNYSNHDFKWFYVTKPSRLSDYNVSLKRYRDGECCICTESNPDTTFYRCGHHCTHNACSALLDKCPLCRSIIIARLIE